MASETQTELAVYRYPGPTGSGSFSTQPGRQSFLMVNNDICISTVQVFNEKGDGVKLHFHNNEDGYWMVLGGRAQFFNEKDEVVVDLGKFEGVFVPRYTRYYFQNSDDSGAPLEILRVSHHSNEKDDHEGAEELGAYVTKRGKDD